MKLYPHQEVAVNWLSARQRAGLFDEPGLGKTASAICAADAVGGSLLTIVPSVAAWNWQREILAWSPQRGVQVVTSSRETLAARARTIVCTHAMLIKDSILRQIRARHWDVVVLDESHLMRNRTAQRTRAFYQGVLPQARHAWVLTGTPAPNNPTELWAMVHAMDPARLHIDGRPMSWHAFRARYCQLAPSAYGDGWKVVGVKNVPELRARLQGFALRRTKKDHLKLPPLRWGTVALRADEGAMRATLAALDDETRRRVETAASPDEAMEALRTSVHFSAWRRLCGLAKIAPLSELLVSELEGGLPCVVVFAHHLDVLTGLQERLIAAGVSVGRLDGSTALTARQQLVDSFQAGRLRVMLCQLTAGGVAITLTRASSVVFAELSWTPGDNLQAADRLHRISQANSVLARSVLLAGSIDELVVDTLSRKLSMLNEVLR